MKELEDNKGKRVYSEIVSQIQNKKETKLIGSQRKTKGLTMFKYNEITKETTLANYKKEPLFIIKSMNREQVLKDLQKRRIIEIEPNCIYFQALNMLNAQRKIINLYF